MQQPSVLVRAILPHAPHGFPESVAMTHRITPTQMRQLLEAIIRPEGLGQASSAQLRQAASLLEATHPSVSSNLLKIADLLDSAGETAGLMASPDNDLFAAPGAPSVASPRPVLSASRKPARRPDPGAPPPRAAAPVEAPLPEPAPPAAEPQPSGPATTELWNSTTAIDKARVNVDGASKGNPGPAGGGIVFTAPDGSLLHEEAVPHPGRLTNNVAEYLTLLKAVELAAARGISHLEIISDSELMVKQLRGEYRVKHEDLIPLAEHYRSLRPKFKTVKLLAVRREFNKRADELANHAIRQAKK